ncbi:E3 ubiquitin-protein ligase XIAP-like [Mercenaria mercenaria]|uniref:E3 ubiquitin-protein ligase XIAP-like n=1 Tax=Mercenaria mercenaria TaxID=6596 RepID=UPI00234FACE8|nr:E3 ubiquitin-protein ligase XIAP-like [Mercenaria mercenaria]XP_053389603.1 E3 ubiquitin-protein ligase XIAP-like [Mercenaria mercenaria]XP_053389604.1 E3 ubiquitin-protein ligase XIAP-like [Mercenaria mercenaria]
MEHLSKTSCFYSRILVCTCTLLLLTIITKIVNNVETGNSILKLKQAGTLTCTGLKQFMQKISIASKILSCFPNCEVQSNTEFGNHDNISSVIEAITAQQKRENITRDIPIVRRKHIQGKQYTCFISSRNLNDKNTTAILRKEYSIIDVISYIIVLLATLSICTNSTFYFQKSKHFSRSKDESKARYSYDFIFHLGNQSVFEFKVYHFSLKQYLNEIEKESDKNIKRMYHEWARYESFKTFPKDCTVSTLRLAQAGFYYTGNGVETACFSCGVKNEKWTGNESVIELHKRLSPKCKFINGERTENVPIHGIGESEQNQSGGACGGPEDLSENNAVRETGQKKHIEHRNEITRTRNEVSQETEQNLEQTNTNTGNSFQNPLENERHIILQNGYSGQHSEYRPTEEIQHFPGITNEQPKHPDYATRGVRLSSFSQWPLGHVMKPEDLAEAGFFFCGMQDLVRCFFCGGGMKNWEYGDSPWIEHARWFPTCAYLKQCKGEDFVNLCQISNMTFPTHTNFQLRDLDSQQANIVEDQYITDLNSIAAKRVLDMGYMQTQVEDAIRNIRQRIGPVEELKAQNILEYLLDSSYTANASTTTTTSVQHSNTANNGSQSSPNNRQSDQSNVSIDTTERSSPEQSADKNPKATKDERKALKEENQHLKEQMMCKICMDKDANTVFLPCGHLVSCVECAHALRKCAVCRTVIQGTVRAYAA